MKVLSATAFDLVKQTFEKVWKKACNRMQPPEESVIMLIDNLQQPNNSPEDIENMLAALETHESLIPTFFALLQSNNPDAKKYISFISLYLPKFIDKSPQILLQNLEKYQTHIIEMVKAGSGISYLKIFLEYSIHLLTETSFFPDLLNVCAELASECCRNQFNDPEQVERLEFSFLYLDLYRRKLDPGICEIDSFAFNFFPIYFTIDNFFNPNLIKSTQTFLQSYVYLSRYSFPLYLEANIIDGILNIIPYLEIIPDQQIKINEVMTKALIEMVKCITEDFLIWVINHPDRYIEERNAFAERSFDKIVIGFFQIAKKIHNSLPNDIYGLIPRYLLQTAYWYYLSFKPEITEDQFRLFYDLAYTFFEFPPSITFEENPIHYYQNAYCLSDVILEPRTFSTNMIQLLCDINLEFVFMCLQSSTGQLIIPFLGVVLRYMVKNNIFKNLQKDTIDAIRQTVSNLVAQSTDDYDTLFLLVQAMRILPDDNKLELYQRGLLFVNEIEVAGQQDPDSVTEQDKVNFTVGCSIIQAIIANRFPIDLIPETIISTVLSYSQCCITDDAITIILHMLNVSKAFVEKNANQILQVIIDTILIKTDNFYLNTQHCDKCDKLILEKAFKVLTVCLGFCDETPFRIMKKILMDFFMNTHLMELTRYLNEFLNSVALAQWAQTPQVLTLYLRGIVANPTFLDNNPIDLLLTPFYNFFAKSKEMFQTWEASAEFAEFILKIFFSVPLLEDLSSISQGLAEIYDRLYYSSRAISMMILNDFPFDFEAIFSNVIQRIRITELPNSEHSENALIFYSCFDLLSTIAIKFVEQPIPNDVYDKFHIFVSKGFVFRASEKVRYLYFVEMLKVRSPDPALRELLISDKQTILQIHEIPYFLDYEWFQSQEVFGLF